MSGPLGAMAAWFSATPMREHQGSRESVWGNAEAHQKLTFATLQGRGLGADRGELVPSSDSNYPSEWKQNKAKPACFYGSVRFADQNVTALIELSAERT